MIYWAPLLHFYQPPLQLHGILNKICDESYRPLIEVFRQHPNAKATVNINGVLTEMLWENGHQDVIEGLKELAEKGQLEFTGSAKYHAILPLIPHREMDRQIRRNNMTNSHFFGELYEPKGFFPPEMAYSRDILEPVVASRHEWIILSGVACPAPWPLRVIHEIAHDDSRLAVFFRDDILSNKISFQSIDGPGFLEHLRQLGTNSRDVYIVTAMDAETFGHHIQNWEQLFLAEVYEALEPALASYDGLQQRKLLAEQHKDLFELREKGDGITAVKISELLDRFPRSALVDPRPSSWSTSARDIEGGNFYPLWKDPNNRLHQLQWQHMNLCIDMENRAQHCADNTTAKHFALIARGLLDQALHSCQFWWASRRPMWDINMVSRGLMQQREVILNAYKAIKTSGAGPEIKEEYYYRVVATRDLSNRITDILFED